MAASPRALALAAVAALLLFGCVSEPKPASGMQGVVVQNAEGLLGNVQNQSAAPQPATTAQQISCTLAVKQSVILAGEQADISLSSRFPGSARFDLVCGNETRSLLSENTLVLETKCKFDTPGQQTILVRANGRECASATVVVRRKAGGNCSIDSASIEKDLATFYYKWTVHFDGFADGDVLTWACDNTVAKETLSSDPVWGMPRLEALSCDFPSRPVGDYINVSISGVPCGQVPTR